MIKDIAVDAMVRRPRVVENDAGGYEENGATRRARLNRGVLDVAFGEIARQLEYKTERYGSKFVELPVNFPSARTCSNCGHVKDEFPLEIRVFDCEVCGASFERALNAARNVHQAGQQLAATPAAT